jgi:two-component system response regulator ResD
MCILDVMMPVYNGWEVLKEIRGKSNVPVLMLTALGDEQYEIRGLKNGADDYIAKPFSFPVLTARIETLLRRVKQEQERVLKYGELTINRGCA